MSDAREITLANEGRWHGSYGTAPCPVCQPEQRKDQCAATLADGQDGRLLAHCKKSGCAFTAMVAAWGLTSGPIIYTPPDPAEIARRDAEAKALAERAERKALATWRESLPIAGTIAEAYLRNRGITCDLPDTLRFHPDCWHPSARRFPAMVSLVEGLNRVAIHRTYLRPNGSGKADVEPAKAMQGKTAGGAVRLTKGAGPLVVAEGIETALSLASGLLSRPVTVWAALSTSGMAGLILPDVPGRLTVASDGERAGREAAHQLAERATAQGWTVSTLPAPDGRDWNDVLLSKGAH